jgi:hypothetical protein
MESALQILKAQEGVLEHLMQHFGQHFGMHMLSQFRDLIFDWVKENWGSIIVNSWDFVVEMVKLLLEALGGFGSMAMGFLAV